jgi:hypothetical protein
MNLNKSNVTSPKSEFYIPGNFQKQLLVGCALKKLNWLSKFTFHIKFKLFNSFEKM